MKFQLLLMLLFVDDDAEWIITIKNKKRSEWAYDDDDDYCERRQVETEYKN